MAHQIETMAYAGEVPWHGLGVKVDHNLSPQEMLKAAGLDWNVNLYPAFADINGTSVPVGRSALIRDSDNSVLTVVSDDWHPIQNTEAFEFFNEFVEAGNMQMHTAGSIKDGTKVWALAKIDESFDLFNGRDVVESYLLFTNPHIYGVSADVRHTPTRVVCNNTLTWALSERSEMQLSISHRKKFDAEQVKKALGISKFQLNAYREKAEFLVSKFFNNQTKEEYVSALYPSNNDEKLSRNAQKIIASIETQPGAELGEGTFWSLYNAVTYNIDHEFGRSNSTRLDSAWYGAGRKIKNKALDLAVEMAEAA